MTAAILAAFLAGCGVGSSGAAGATTTPLGCSAGLPTSPLSASEAQLGCTERALIGQVCDLDPDHLEQETSTDTPVVRSVDYHGTGRLQDAHFSYFSAGNNPYSTVANLNCDLPGGDAQTKVGQVQLTAEDWASIASAGTALPVRLQPQNLKVPHAAPPTVASAPSLPPTADSGFADCDARATDVFTRLANSQITLTQARRQLPAAVPTSALTTGLAGVRQYQQDGIGRADAINEAAGAVGQSCPR